MTKYLSATAIILMCSLSLYASVPADGHISGYIEGVLYKTYGITSDVEVRNGIVYIPAQLNEHPHYNEIEKDILNVYGVKEIRVADDSDFEVISLVTVLPSDTLFRPLLADPKWPRFAASYNYHTDYTYYRNAFDAVFGKDFSLFRIKSSETSYTELGLQAAAYVTFDLGVSTFALMNTDYLFGVPLTVKWDKTAIIARIYHLSSHLGDDYLALNPGVENRDITFEKFDFLVEYRPEDWVRLYGGGGSMIAKSPSSIDRLSYQFGFELYNLPESLLEPTSFVAVDIKGFQETGYTPNYSAKLGIIVDHKMVMTLDFYSGDSPHGQFYNNRVTWFGASLAFYM